MIRSIKELGKKELGFTLIEVMVVIIMVGILAAIAVPIYTNYLYRARTSEAVSTMGAVKTFMLERANATGSWPDREALYAEFRDFSEVYYFETPEIVGEGVGQPIADNPQIAIRMQINPTTFGRAGDDYIQLDIDTDTEEDDNNGWSGQIMEDYADHLPRSSNPIS